MLKKSWQPGAAHIQPSLPMSSRKAFLCFGISKVPKTYFTDSERAELKYDARLESHWTFHDMNSLGLATESKGWDWIRTGYVMVWHGSQLLQVLCLMNSCRGGIYSQPQSRQHQQLVAGFLIPRVLADACLAMAWWQAMCRWRKHNYFCCVCSLSNWQCPPCFPSQFVKDRSRKPKGTTIDKIW